MKIFAFCSYGHFSALFDFVKAFLKFKKIALFIGIFHLTFNSTEFTITIMDLRTVLTPETVNLHLKGKTKEEIIDEMLDILVKAGKVTDKVAARDCVLERERKMSTGMKHGIAIPHGKTDTVSDLVACIGISDNPVDFDSLDQDPCRIFIMTLSPVNKTGPHLQFLAEVSLLFKSAGKRQQILETQDKAEVIKILTE